MYTDTENDGDRQRDDGRYLVGVFDTVDRRNSVLWDLGLERDKLGLAVSSPVLRYATS